MTRAEAMQAPEHSGQKAVAQLRLMTTGPEGLKVLPLRSWLAQPLAEFDILSSLASKPHYMPKEGHAALS